MLADILTSRATLNLAAYVTGSTSSHYDWAIKKIRKHKRGLKN
nr:ClbS/DfsB family four-helix bundle protein [uncultured Campylobacter sp.]